MRRSRIEVLGAALLATSLQGSLAHAQHPPINDGDFQSGWELTVVKPPQASVAAGVFQDGGNPGAYYHTRHEHPLVLGQGGPTRFLVTSRYLYTNRPFRPYEDGAIARLRFTFQKKRLDPLIGIELANVAFYPILRQGSRTYTATNPRCQSVVDEWGLYLRAWTTFSADCSASDFDDLDETGEQNPDFSAGGIDIQVGFALLSSAGGDFATPTVVVEAGLDTFSVRADPEDPPPQTTVPGLSIAIDDHGVFWANNFDPGEGFYGVRYDMAMTNTQAVPGLFEIQVVHNTNLRGWSDISFFNCEEFDCRSWNGFEIPTIGAASYLFIAPLTCGLTTDEVLCHRPEHTIFAVAHLQRLVPGGSETVARACAATPGVPCFVDGLPCCLAEALGAAFRCPQILPTAPAVIERAAADTEIDAALLYMLRDRVLRATPGGRRATELYYEWTDDVVRTAILHPSLFGLARDALLAWQPLLRELVEGRGERSVVTADHMRALNTFLGALKQVAPADLRGAVEQEETNWQLASWTGLTIEQAQARMGRSARMTPVPSAQRSAPTRTGTRENP